MIERSVPVAGVDRLRLNAPLAVQDLLTAIRFALQPEDDLALASLLVSPLIGWSQDELMHAAVGRRTPGARGEQQHAAAQRQKEQGMEGWLHVDGSRAALLPSIVRAIATRVKCEKKAGPPRGARWFQGSVTGGCRRPPPDLAPSARCASGSAPP